MKTAAILFESASCLLTLLAVFILGVANKEDSYPKKLLAFLLLILALISLNAVVLYSGGFMYVPVLHKVLAPVYLLIYPVAFLYVRSVLRWELRFKKSDWWLLVPSVLYFINLIPYYLIPIEEKRTILLNLYNDNRLISRFSEGIFPAYVFPFVRVIWSFFFVGASYRLIARFKKQEEHKVLTDNKELLRWLTILNGLLCSLVIIALLVAIAAAVYHTANLPAELYLGVVSVFICVQLFLRPQLLYGVYHPLPAMYSPENELEFSNTLAPATLSIKETGLLKKNEETPEALLSTNDRERLLLKKEVEALFEQQKPFLRTDYTLERMVLDTGTPRYMLSAFINREYGMGFREFINRYRVDYFKQNLGNPTWNNLTLEAISEQCGFNSRTTFIKNFKEITGQTPSDYVKANS